MVSAQGLRLAIFSDTFPPQVNGVARTLERLVHAVEQRGGEVRVVTVEDPDARPDPRVVRWPSIPFWAYPQLRIAAPLVGRATEFIDTWKPTIVHSTTEFGVGLGGLFAARRTGVPFVSSYHTHFEQYINFYKLQYLNPIAWPFLRAIHNAGRMTWVPSEVVAAELRVHGFENVRVWSRGVDHTRFNPGFRSADLRRRLGASDDTVVVAYVGRIAPEKGIGVAMDAMRLVLARHPGKVVFALAGDGPAEAASRAAAPAGTTFLGKLTGRELSEFYASADLFAFPSTTETFGNVVLEAMASRLAVIGPDFGATTELAGGDRALQFRAHDAASLADAVETLVRDPALRTRIAEAGYAEALRRTWDAVYDRLISDYLEVLRP